VVRSIRGEGAAKGGAQRGLIAAVTAPGCGASGSSFEIAFAECT